MNILFDDMIDTEFTRDSMDTIVFEKIVKGSFVEHFNEKRRYVPNIDERFRIFKRDKKSYYITCERYDWTNGSWLFREGTTMFKSLKQAKFYLGEKLLDHDACSNWIERIQFDFYHFNHNKKSIIGGNFKKAFRIATVIVSLILFVIYLKIGGDFIFGGLQGVGIEDGSELFEILAFGMYFILFMIPIYFLIKWDKK